jgi:hypothetical protein
MALKPLLGHFLLIVVDSRSLSHTPHSAGLFWKSDQPEEENSNRLQIDIHAVGGFEPAIPASMRPFNQALVCGTTLISYYDMYRL